MDTVSGMFLTGTKFLDAEPMSNTPVIMEPGQLTAGLIEHHNDRTPYEQKLEGTLCYVIERIRNVAIFEKWDYTLEELVNAEVMAWYQEYKKRSEVTL